MMNEQQINNYNEILLEKLSIFLNIQPDYIQPDMIDELMGECGVSKEYAYSMMLAAAIGLDIVDCVDDRRLFESYFSDMIHHLDTAVYKKDPYYSRIKIPEVSIGRWELKQERFNPYEAFVCDDLYEMPDGRVIPQIGFFDREFEYPAVLENGREWMLITPEEIATSKPAIEKADGKVLTYGLGFGYFAYMVAQKANVSSVTVVEKDENVIQLFNTYILPQFNCADKINIVNEDAFVFAEKHMAAGGFDFVFADIWHDPSDGVDLYLKMKQYEKLSPQSTFMYWIEKTILCYLPK